MKSLKMILKQDVKGLGKKGEQVDVSEGYGRNYLLPRGLALLASDGTIREASLIKDGKDKKAAGLRQKAEDLAAKLQGKTFTVRGRSGEGSKLYGAITNSQIAEELERVVGKKIDKRKVDLAEPIKTLGDYQIQVRLYPGVIAVVDVKVVAAE